MPRSRTVSGRAPARPEALPQKALGNPDLYPDEFKAWLPRFLSQNLNMQLAVFQIPQAEQDTQVGSGDAAPVFVNSWVNFGSPWAPASYYRDPYRRVHLGGVIKGGVIGGQIFTLPTGYAPTAGGLVFVVPSGNAVGTVTVGICTVNTDGTVVAVAGDNHYFSLSGISYRQSA